MSELTLFKLIYEPRYLFINSGPPMLAKALVRRFESLLKGLDVKPIVAAADCLPRRSQHPLKFSLERVQVRLRQVSVAIDCPLQPPRPGSIIIILYGVENLVALRIEELGRDKLSGIMHRPLATVLGAVARRRGLIGGQVQARRHRVELNHDRPSIR